MNKRMREILNKIELLRNKAQSLMDEGNTADANAVLDEIALCQQRFEVERRLFESDSQRVQNQFEENKKTTSLAESASAMRALIKKTMGKSLTDSENALVIPTTGDGDNGEGFLLPVDVSVKIERKLRDYSSLREVVGHMPVSALSGSYWTDSQTKTDDQCSCQTQATEQKNFSKVMSWKSFLTRCCQAQLQQPPNQS